MALLVLSAGLALSCGTLNNLGQVQPQDLCQCAPLDLGLEYRHMEKHIPIAVMPALPLTIDTMYSWAQPDPGSLDPPRTAVELQVFHIAVAFVQEVSVNSEDCDIHVEISQTPDKTARRVIVETPVDTEFCTARKNLQTQLAQHGFRLDPTHGGELLPQGLPADVVGMAFLDFDHTAIGLSARGSPQVTTLWELHPAIVTLLP
ncbi:MAG TPA: hypothetical protein VFQ18_09275 [Candidatus Acidoferrum sp.]|jgi:hypothetical protein|nr:hypothetical protein [Candidatus Acidoferrum sp.]